MMRFRAMCICFGALMLAPLAAHSSIELGTVGPGERDPQIQLPSVSQKPVPPLRVGKDPFSGDKRSATVLPMPRGQADLVPPISNAVGIEVKAGAPIAVLPPNRGATESESSSALRSDVRAIIVGERAEALIVDSQGLSRIVSVGDRIDGHKIIAIDQTQIRLDDGSVLRIAQGNQP